MRPLCALPLLSLPALALAPALTLQDGSTPPDANERVEHTIREDDLLSAFRNMDLDALRSLLPLEGRSGGFMDFRIPGDRFAMGLAIGWAREHPGRVDDLWALRDSIDPAQRAMFLGSMCVAVGPERTLQLVAAVEEPDEDMRMLAAFLESGERFTLTDFGVCDKDQRAVLKGVLAVRLDPHAAALLVSALAQDERCRDDVVEFLEAVCAIDDGTKRFVAALRPVVREDVQPLLDEIVQ